MAVDKIKACDVNYEKNETLETNTRRSSTPRLDLILRKSTTMKMHMMPHGGNKNRNKKKEERDSVPKVTALDLHSRPLQRDSPC